MFTDTIRSGIMDQIRCDEKDYLIWKWRPSNNVHRENAIRWGSSLRVKQGSVAVFVYKNKGQDVIQEYIEGPFDKTLKTSNLPVIANLVALAYGGETPFQAEVYFINLAKVIQTKFAVRYFNVFDPRYPEFGIPVAVRGTLTFSISDYRRFIEIHRLDEFNTEELQAQIKDLTSRKIKSVVANLPTNEGVSILQLEKKTEEVSGLAKSNLEEQLNALHGIRLLDIDISALDIDKASDDYQNFVGITRDVTAATIQAQTQADIKSIHDMQRIKMQNIEEQLRIEREESQYAIHKQTQSANLPAYQIEAQTTVGVAGAEALGHMGKSDGEASVSGTGLDITTVMAGMAIGGSVGRNIASSIDGTFSPTIQAPPPIPPVGYYLVESGRATGPYTIETLQQKASAGSLNKMSLVWKSGMPDWQAAGQLPELTPLFSGPATPPPIPQQ